MEYKVHPPKVTTLKKYGLTRQEWIAILLRQDMVCAVCHKAPKSGKLNVDHEHVKGWKKMSAPERKKYVRGLLCFVCNFRYLSKGMNLDRARHTVSYLSAYESRKHPILEVDHVDRT